MNRTTLLALAVAAEALSCTSSSAPPKLASSAGQATYALEYPSVLQGLSNEQANCETQIRALSSEFAKYPDQLKDPPWDEVVRVVEHADEAGRSQGYVDQQRSTENVQRFFTTEHDELTRRISGSVQFVAKKKNYDFDSYGAVSSSLKEGVDKQLERRLHVASEAQFAIERMRDVLGKQNAATLEKQADNITMASYLANVELARLHVRADEVVKEADQVKSTLDRSIADEQALGADAHRSGADKKASSERMARMVDARSRVDGRVGEVATMSKELEQKDAAIQKEYADALNNLLNALKARASAKK